MSLWKLNHLQILNPSPHLGLSFYELSTVEIQPPLFVLDLRKLVVDGDWTKFQNYSPKWWFTMLESAKKHQKHLKHIQVKGWFMSPTTILQVRRTTWDGAKNHVCKSWDQQPTPTGDRRISNRITKEIYHPKGSIHHFLSWKLGDPLLSAPNTGTTNRSMTGEDPIPSREKRFPHESHEKNSYYFPLLVD